MGIEVWLRKFGLAGHGHAYVAALMLASFASTSTGQSVPEPPATEVLSMRSFSQSVAGMTPETAYSFGWTAQVPWAHHGHAIRDLGQLAAHFNPLQDFTGATTINSELQVYQAAFNPLDHRIGGDGLGLWANLHSDEWSVRTGSQVDGRLGWALNGAPITWDQIPSMLLPYAGEWRVGQLVALQNKGVYMVSELRPGEQLRLQKLLNSSGSGNFQYNLIAFLPIDTVTTTEPYTNPASTLVFAPGALPPTIRVGYRVAVVAGDEVVRNAADVWVAAIDHARGLVQLSRDLPFGVLPAGQRYIFYPRITSGQVWTKRQWDITQPSAFFAAEFDITLFKGLDPAYESAGLSNASLWSRSAAAYPDAPVGAWPALWAYSADDGDASKVKGTSEIDFMELWVSSNSGMRIFSTGNVGGQLAWARTGDGYSTTSNGKNRLPYSMAGDHKVALIYQNGRTYHYVDDVLVRIEDFQWTSQAPLQIGMNLAMGALTRGLAANLNFPFQVENFQRAHMDVKSLRIWHRRQ